MAQPAPPERAERPEPPRRPTGTGIVHFGPGAFHRAHQADYVDRLLASDPRWGIAAVSLRSAETVSALARQQGRYTLALLDRQTQLRSIAVHTGWFGPGDGAAVRRTLRNPQVRIVTSTVTEKGYCLAPDGTLDFDHRDIRQDLEEPTAPGSLVGWLALGLADRRAAGLPPFVSLCCDNMVANGRKLRDAVVAYAGRLDPALADWIAGEATFPNTMVDAITPATDDRLRALVRKRGFDDAIPVAREAYRAWVVEDVLPPGGPDLASAGATLAGDVGAWERAKLRILNGAHSTLAYLGLLGGHETVADAMGDPPLAGFVERLVRRDMIPGLVPSPLDLSRYADEILARFRNPAIGHRLAQIAADGSQKLPYRLLDPAAEALAAGRAVHRLAWPVAAWMLFVERQVRQGEGVADPLSGVLAAAARDAEPEEALLSLSAIFPPALAQDHCFAGAVRDACRRLRSVGVREALAAMPD